jgi:signal transduction histidine kinase
VLQARGARRSLAADPDTARGALDAIEQTASQALAEMRRLLAMLRADDAMGLAPQPSLAHLETLAGQVGEAGLPVELVFEGERRELSPGVDLAAFRIVQEALTNALKHAGPARARVVVRCRADEVELEIADDGAGAANGDGTGHGLAGMRARVSLYGGRLESGPGSAGGFLVRARLPG